MLISRKMGDARKSLTFVSKNARFHTFRPEKRIQGTFFTHKIAFYFSEIFEFLEIDLLRKKMVITWYFLTKMKENVFFSKKKSKKKFFLPPVSRKLAFYVFSDNPGHNY